MIDKKLKEDNFFKKIQFFKQSQIKKMLIKRSWIKS
jgi:hypothetical protein